MSMSNDENQNTLVPPDEDGNDAADSKPDKELEPTKTPLPNTTTSPWIKNT
jgi:hypothetical protein